jgi:GTP-binding protein of the ras superfamily involved in termination of M-phase
MEKSIVLRNTEITFSIWDLGGQREFLSMLPLVCNDAVAIFFMFDLSRKSTLLSIKEWYRQARGLNRVSLVSILVRLFFNKYPYRNSQTAYAFLIGTKYDMYATLPPEEMEEIDKLARKYAKAMKAPLIFSSASHSINVQKMFKIVLAKVFDLKSTVAEITTLGEPLLIFSDNP